MRRTSDIVAKHFNADEKVERDASGIFAAASAPSGFKYLSVGDTGGPELVRLERSCCHDHCQSMAISGDQRNLDTPH
jgi:hypothetical protein